ncbi:MAG: cysteine hydrolase family protein [Alphaproteobacteria bacterium]
MRSKVMGSMDNTVLIPIDMQLGFDFLTTKRNNPMMEENGQGLLSAWRQLRAPLIHVRHESIHPQDLFHPSHPGYNFHPSFVPLPGEVLVTKSANSALIGTDLDLRLRRAKVGTVVLFGFVTDMCVSTTARHASNLGYKTIVIEDACACFDIRDKQGLIPARDIHRIHIATLAQEFATIMTTAALLKELPHPR